MFNLEFKEPAAVLMVIAALAIFISVLGIIPFAPGIPPLAMWSRLVFAALGVASLIGALAISRRKEQKAEKTHANNTPPIDRQDPLLLEPNSSSRHLHDYQLSFSDECRSDLRLLGLDEADVINFVTHEFKNHVNYFLYDLEDYILPVRSGFLVFLDKIESRIAFKAVRKCTISEAKLASWNGILAIYRRASRLAYRGRGSSHLILSNKAMLPTALTLHDQIDRRISRHFFDYEGMNLLAAPEIEDPGNAGMQDELRKLASPRPDRLPIAQEVSLRLRASKDALSEAETAAADLENSFITEESAVASIVIALELSLQHIHKVLSRFPPTE